MLTEANSARGKGYRGFNSPNPYNAIRQNNSKKITTMNGNRNNNFLNGETARNYFGNCVAQSFASGYGMPFKHAEALLIKLAKQGLGSYRAHNGRETLAGMRFTSKNVATILNSFGRKGFSAHVLCDTYKSDTWWNKFTEELNDQEFKGVSYEKNGCTLKSLGKRFPKGRFIVLTKGHATALVNGRLYNDGQLNAGRLTARVQYIIELGTK